MDKGNTVKLMTVSECYSDNRKSMDMYYIVTSEGDGCDVELTYEDIVAIHELTGKVIMEKERKEVQRG